MAIENVKTIDKRTFNIVRNRDFDCCLSPDCKLFLVALVLDCFGYLFSRPIFNTHFRYTAIKNVNTIDERRSKIVRNRDFDCRLSPHCKLFLVALVLDCFGYLFSRPIFNIHFRYTAMENVNTIDEHRSKIV